MLVACVACFFMVISSEFGWRAIFLISMGSLVSFFVSIVTVNGLEKFVLQHLWICVCAFIVAILVSLTFINIDIFNVLYILFYVVLILLALVALPRWMGFAPPYIISV